MAKGLCGNGQTRDMDSNMKGLGAKMTEEGWTNADQAEDSSLPVLGRARKGQRNRRVSSFN